MKIGILGGTGQAGRRIARLLARETECDIALLGRDKTKLERTRQEIAEATGKKCLCVVCDASKPSDVSAALAGMDLLIIALSSAAHLENILNAAIDAHVDCLDILLSSAEKHALLKSKRDAILKSGICYITDGGYHPGLPAAMVRWAENVCPGLTRAEVYGVFSVDWASVPTAHETMVDFVRELSRMKGETFSGGKWIQNWNNIKYLNIQKTGRKIFYPMELDEMRLLPGTLPRLRDLGFFIAGFGLMIDWVVMPTVLVAVKIVPAALPWIARYFDRALKRFGGKRNAADLWLRGEGASGKIALRLSYPDAYEFTALPVVACVKQYLDADKRAGVWHQAHYVVPARFFDDLKNMGVRVDVETT